MFKCKIDLAEYNKNDNSKPNIELAKAKNLSKGAVKKLAGKPEQTTNFYLSKDFFENKGKPVGHFFALGVSKKLSKQFETKEMKGKADAIAKDAKSAATGEVCVKEINGKMVLQFMPHDKSKIPAGQWPKLLKSLKAFFAGLKAIVLIDGETIEEEPGGEVDAEDAGGFTPDVSVDPTDAVDENEEVPADAPVTPAELQAEIKQLIADVKAFMAAEWAAVTTEKSAKSMMLAWRRAKEIVEDLNLWIKNAGSNANLQKEIAVAKTTCASVEAIVGKLQTNVDKIKAKLDEKNSNISLDTITNDITGKISDLLKGFTDELNAIPGLKEALNLIK